MQNHSSENENEKSTGRERVLGCLTLGSPPKWNLLAVSCGARQARGHDQHYLSSPSRARHALVACLARKVAATHSQPSRTLRGATNNQNNRHQMARNTANHKSRRKSGGGGASANIKHNSYTENA